MTQPQQSHRATSTDFSWLHRPAQIQHGGGVPNRMNAKRCSSLGNHLWSLVNILSSLPLSLLPQETRTLPPLHSSPGTALVSFSMSLLHCEWLWLVGLLGYFWAFCAWSSAWPSPNTNLLSGTELSCNLELPSPPATHLRCTQGSNQIKWYPHLQTKDSHPEAQIHSRLVTCQTYGIKHFSFFSFLFTVS